MQRDARPGERSTWRLRLVFLAGAVVLLAGCAAGPQRPAASPDRDGPEPNPPADLARVPDAEPRLEPIRSGGPNKPYELLGKSYVPITQDAPFDERGLASWYGRKFQGRRTASGEVYDMYAMTAAHPTLPIPSYARIRNPANGREVVVRINDRGPFHPGRIVDLSYTAALKLGVLRGVAPVELQRITADEIRSGAWRHEGDVSATAVARAGVELPAMAVAAVAVPASLATPIATRTPAPAPMPMPAPTPTPTPPASEPAANPTAAPAPVVAAAEPVADAPAARAFTPPARGFWVQLGAFRARDGAEGFQQRVAAEMGWLSPLLAVFADASLFRLQAGPYPSRDEARSVAERVREGLKLVPTIVERR